MDENNVEQPKVEPAAADNPTVRSNSETIGKFADVTELAKAYENLQAEFTRKSQLLAKLTQGQAGAAIQPEMQSDAEETSPVTADAVPPPSLGNL